MKQILCLVIFFFSAYLGNGQNYNLDNIRYQTISWNRLFDLMDANPHLLLYDIRTPGEQNDTSEILSINQGRISGAKNIDFYEIDKYLPDLLQHKEDTIYLFCSHSMRSRRLATRLADSSFKHVVNINGGITYLNLLGESHFPLKRKYYRNNLPYHLVSAMDFSSKLNDKNVLAIDVRSDSSYYGISKDDEDNSYGTINGAVHYTMESSIDSILKFKDKELLLFDNYGDESALFAKKLLDYGFKKVSVLHFGLYQLRNSIPSSERNYLKSEFTYILPEELFQMQKTKKITIIDIRTRNEFLGKDSASWKNAGSIKNAVNLPFDQLSKETLAPYVSDEIVIYDNMMLPEIYQSAEKIKNFGAKHLYILSGGIFMINWTAANTDKHFLKDLIDKSY